MTTAVIKRRPAARQQPARRPPPKPMVRLPVAPGRLRRHVVTIFLVLAAAAAIVVLILMRMPQRAWDATAQAASRAGFEVRHVDVHGVANGPRLAVITAALEGPTNSMLLVDLPAARARLRALPWVADASVIRRLPDTLIVDIVERQPVALWQFRQRLTAVDVTGARLTSDRLERFAKLPLIIGSDANAHVAELLALLATHARIGNTVDAATYVGSRRWDLRLRSGEIVSLPEAGASAALARFDALDQRSGLIGKGYARFDLRQPGRMTVRLPVPVKPVKPGKTKPVSI